MDFILSAIASTSELVVTETPFASCDTVSVTWGTALPNVLVALFRVYPPAAGFPTVICASAAVADEVALADCQVGLTGVSADGGVNASAAVCSAASLLFTDWYAEMTAFSLVTAFFRLVCGCAASCISWLITCEVFMPLTRPSTVVVLPMSSSPRVPVNMPPGGRPVDTDRPPDGYAVMCSLVIQLPGWISPGASGRPA